MTQPTVAERLVPDQAGGIDSSTQAGGAHSVPQTTGPDSAGRYFTGFEILRAMAAVMVVIHHADAYAGPARSGWLHELAAVGDSGVAVFFVLSGFLITRPFIVAHLQDRPSQRTLDFWWRRLLRIVPAYWLVLSFFWALGSFSLGENWWRYYFFLQIYSKDTALGGVVQAWSLNTEISFYLLVPIWAWVVRRIFRGSTHSRVQGQLAVVGCIWLGGFMARTAIERVAPSYRGLSFNWLATNLDLFATGMGLAVISAWAASSPEVSKRLDSIAKRSEWWWLGAGVLFVWYAYEVGPAPSFEIGYSGWFWHRRQFVLALFTALLMVPTIFGPQSDNGLRRLWTLKPLAWVGTVSYGLYLWHFDWMKRSISHTDPFGLTGWKGWVHSVPGNSNVWWLIAVGMGVGLSFAAASWYLLEQPLQRFKHLARTGRSNAA